MKFEEEYLSDAIEVSGKLCVGSLGQGLYRYDFQSLEVEYLPGFENTVIYSMTESPCKRFVVLSTFFALIIVCIADFKEIVKIQKREMKWAEIMLSHSLVFIHDRHG